MIGLFIHREECTAVLCDMKLNILDKVSEAVNEENSTEFCKIIYRVTDSILSGAKDERIAGIGVGSVGPIDIEKGMILNPPNFFGIRDFEIVSFLKERYKMPVYLDSLNNCAALAEKYYGLGKCWKDFIFVGIANGIGSGIISDDRIFRNSNGLTINRQKLSGKYRNIRVRKPYFGEEAHLRGCICPVLIRMWQGEEAISTQHF